VADDLPVTDSVRVPGTAISTKAVRSGGPGGQNVNKVSSKIELRIDITRIEGLDEGARARLVPFGSLGEKDIELDQGHESAGLMDPGAAIASKTGIGLDNLMETLGEIGKDVKGVTYALNQSIGGGNGRQNIEVAPEALELPMEYG